MPSNVVKSPKDEKLWDRAKEQAEKQGHKENWAYVMAIYKNMNPDRFKEATTGRVADRFLAAYEETGRDPKEGWAHGRVEPIQRTDGEGSQVPFARDNQGQPLDPPDLGTIEIPGYEWHDKSKAFHSIGDKTASDRTASLQIELKWAADAVDRANELLREVADTLDARRHGEESISDVVGAAAGVTRALRAVVSPQLTTLTRTLRHAI